jgi:hypothetical protein
VVLKLCGGQGNQMFEYAAGKALALRNGSQLILDISSYPEPECTIYTLDCFDINDYVTKEYQKPTIIEQEFHYNPHILNIKGYACISGIWQSEKYFQGYEDAVRAAFRFRHIADDVLANEIRNVNSVAVHVRRGAYCLPGSVEMFGLCKPSYYQAAYQMVRLADPDAKFFIFTNEADWDGLKDFEGQVVSAYRGPWRHPDAFKTGPYELQLMSLCKHHIIANSTFSWWGAWLKTRKGLTIAPKVWFENPNYYGYGPNKVPHNTGDIIPESWIRI